VVRVVLDEAEQDTARELLSGWPVRTDGPAALMVDGAGGREVNEALGRGGLWARQIRVERPGLEAAFLRLTLNEEENDAPSPR
jgi:hypothetical protein